MNHCKACFFALKSVHVIFYSKTTRKPFLRVVNLLRSNRNLFCNEAITKTSSKNSLEQNSQTNIDISDYGPLLQPSYNLAAYADKSPLLQEFIKLGVELYKFDKNPEIGEFLLKLDFEKNIKPYLSFLHHNGVNPDAFGQFITQNPFIFKENLDDLEVRINYLQSKKFDQKRISEIITRVPKWLSYPVTYIDERLGYLQQTFQLTGDEVRKAITQCPSLIKVSKKILLTNVFTLKEEIDLDDKSLKKLFLAVPSLLKKKSYDVISTYDYLTRVMKVSQDLILKQPQILTSRKYIFNERHRFLETLGRAQYNPLLPGYVSLSSLVETNDEEFCENIAKTSIHLFNNFLKTL